MLLSLLLLAGCSERTDKATDNSPPPLSVEAQQAALDRGKAIAAETFSLLSSNLQAAIQSGGISNALPFCSLAASPLTAGMAEKHGVTLRRITHQPRNPASRATDAELAVVKSFQDALATDPAKSPTPMVTSLLAGKATFFAPIVIGNELCLQCHGEPGRDIAAADLAVIRGLYPQDEATGFKLGQLRGAWRIDFPLATLNAKPAQQSETP